jgi:1-acyl-sn-glycerol-3-phosphate acyltransferase
MSHPVSPLLVFFVRLLCGAHGRWVGCAPEPRQRVYLANHGSHVDTLVLWSALPPALRARTRPVAAADYWSRGIRRWIADRVFRAVLVPRGRPDLSREEREAGARAAVETTAAALDDGSSLILFPEGTRHPGPGLGPLKAGIWHLCRLRPGLELVPVWLDNPRRVLPKGEFAPVPFLASATFGAPLALAGGEEKEPFLARLAEAIVELGRR